MPDGRTGGRTGAQAGVPKSWVHQGPSVPKWTPTPSSLKSQLRMFARWPALFIQLSITEAGSAWPWAMFSPQPLHW